MAVSLLLYDACGPGGLVNTLNTGINSPFLKAFFFSIHTSATIGYGSTVPVGLLPISWSRSSRSSVCWAWRW